MVVLKRYACKLFTSLKYITVNVVDRNTGRLVATASTALHSLKTTLESGRSCNAKAAAVVGEVLAWRLKVGGLEDEVGKGIQVDVNKEVENALKDNGVKLILEDNHDDISQHFYWFVAGEHKQGVDNYYGTFDIRLFNFDIRHSTHLGQG